MTDEMLLPKAPTLCKFFFYANIRLVKLRILVKLFRLQVCFLIVRSQREKIKLSKQLCILYSRFLICKKNENKKAYNYVKCLILDSKKIKN